MVEHKDIDPNAAARDKKMVGFLHNLFHPHDYFRVLGADRYTSLKIRIILLDAVLSMVPLIIVITISYFWFQQILKDDFRHQLRWEIENTKQSIEFFVDERLAGLRFLSSTYSYDQLSDQRILADVFSKFKKEVSGLVDIGVIDSNGVQQSYIGPYHLEGKTYLNQDWFNEITVRPSYVSDAFMGYRRMPHYAIAVKKELPEKGTFWVLRATIDMETLKKYASSINLREKDDSFIVNRQGILQTPSRFNGNVLEKFTQCPLPQEEITVRDSLKEYGCMCGFAQIKNSPWVLVTVITSAPYGKIPKIFRNELVLISIASILLGMIVNIVMTNTVVNRMKTADQEREAMIAEIEQANKLSSIGRLAAGVAHEINNPLAIINEKAGLIKDILETSNNLEDNKDKFLVILSGISDSVTRARTVTHRLLGFSRRMDLGHDIIDLNDALKEVIEFLDKEITFRNIQLKLNLGENLPKVTTNKGQIQQVFLNIINNAIDAVEEGGLIEIFSKVKEDKFVQVSIRDTGIGIPKDKLKNIFEPFYTTKEKGKGTGLGLSISYGIVQKLGGTIRVESEPHKGTKFTIEIPLSIQTG
jgi:two-component system, NtrC family, sensor kinase